MKSRIIAAGVLLATAVPILLSVGPSGPPALDGEPYIHDPSTIMVCDGKFYTFGTGGGGLVSDDGWTWRSGAVRPGGGLAPDAIKIVDRYYIAYASKGGGMSGGHAGAINTMWTKTLDPKSPDFGFHDDSIVVTTDGVEDCDAIDPAFLLDPTDGRLWLTYGTFFGYIRIIELDPKTGKRIPGNQPVNIAIAGTDRALTATADGEVMAVPAFTGAPEQLWRIDQLTDGAYRIMPKSMSNYKEPMALTAVGRSTPALGKFDSKSDKARWSFRRLCS
jgi:hypothetical protein